MHTDTQSPNDLTGTQRESKVPWDDLGPAHYYAEKTRVTKDLARTILPYERRALQTGCNKASRQYVTTTPPPRRLDPISREF